jgi:hypothetical protein
METVSTNKSHVNLMKKRENRASVTTFGSV